jgi:hypothetical protein
MIGPTGNLGQVTEDHAKFAGGRKGPLNNRYGLAKAMSGKVFRPWKCVSFRH